MRPAANRFPWPYLSIRLNGWSVAVLSLAFLLAVPVIVVLSHLFEPAGEVWRHLAETVLRDYDINSLLLMVGVAIGVLLLGVSTAWLTSMCQFPGRSVFEWALLLPMAIPAYIIAYTYTGLFDFAGPVQTMIREWTGWGYGDYWFPEIRSIEGAALMLALVLYPYVYLLSRAAFLGQSICVLDVSRTLGNGPWRTFFTVALPLARPAIVAGLSLALMETLADYGTVQYFGVSTFTTGIFRTWYGLNNAAAAAQLSAMLLLVVFALIMLEKISRKQARYHHTSQRHQALTRFELNARQSVMAFLICSGALLFGFVLPAGQLLWWALTTAEGSLDSRFLNLISHTVVLAGTASLLALMLALLLGYGKRQQKSWSTLFAVRLAGMGYAIPGTVIAIGVMIPFASFDNLLDSWA
ncbi:MAG: iron ABC transporter permease, partial [Candidatus Thiodiazotropha sp.]